MKIPEGASIESGPLQSPESFALEIQRYLCWPDMPSNSRAGIIELANTFAAQVRQQERRDTIARVVSFLTHDPDNQLDWSPTLREAAGLLVKRLEAFDGSEIIYPSQPSPEEPR